MAQQPDEEQLTSYFPDPPPFYKHFTEKNLSQLADFKKAHGIADDAAQLRASQLLELPPELRYLVPPEPPTQEAEYTVFGKKTRVHEADNFQETAEYIRTKLWDEQTQTGWLDWKYTQLYPSSPSASDSRSESWSTLDRQSYLFRFLRSIVLSYIELLGVVAQNPTSPRKEEKLKDIMTLLVNMHALVNEYRPHQARETLIRVMEEQVERKRAEVEGVRRMGARVQEVLEGFRRDFQGKIEGVGEAASDEELSEEEKRVERQKEMWDAMDDILVN